MKLKKHFSLIVTVSLMVSILAAPAQALTLSSTTQGYSIFSLFPIFSNWQYSSTPSTSTTTPAPSTTPTTTPAPSTTPTTTTTPAPTPAPAPAPTPAPTTSTGYSFSAFEARVVELCNIERQKAGLKPLVADTSLGKGARMKAKDMVTNNYFSHTSPTYGSPFNMMKTLGIHYSAAGENIASGQQTPEAVVKAWMNSPGHRANILSSKYGKIGVGYAYKSSGSYHHYWVQWFTN